MEGDKGQEQRQGCYVDIWEKVSGRKEKAIHHLQKAAWKNQLMRSLGQPSYSQVKDHPFGISLYSVCMTVVVVQYTCESSTSCFCYELLGWPIIGSTSI